MSQKPYGPVTLLFARLGLSLTLGVHVLAAPRFAGVFGDHAVLQRETVAAVYARELHEQLGVPIGIIDVSWGGKPIEPFIPREAFTTPLLRQILLLADQGDLESLRRIRGGVVVRNPEGRPGAIFGGRMRPLVPFGIRGFLWYQGESNSGRGEDPREYRHKMRAMIEGWRAHWQSTELPVYYVQLPSYPPGAGWIRLREEQRLAESIPHTGMVVTIDIRGDGIHPPDKWSVGRRLAGRALAETYERRIHAGKGPRYECHRVVGSEVWVSFSNATGGLMVGNRPGLDFVKATSDGALEWFELAGADGDWHPAAARIHGEHVIVTCDAVPVPLEVRYAGDVQPQGGNLYDGLGTPASPFCSKLEWLVTPWLRD